MKARLCGVLALASVSAFAQAGWKAGVAKTSITPAEPIWMSGYAARTKPSEGVRQEIYLKALALQDDSGKTVVLVTSDLSGIRREVAEIIAERCEKNFGLARDRLALNASHNHSGPMTGLMRGPVRPGYRLDQKHQEVVRRYTENLVEKAVDVIGASIRNLAPATVHFGQGLAGIAVNRRRDYAGMRHLPAPVDHDVPVLSVRDPNGSLRAIAVGYACHSTVLNDYQINGDWPGYAQAEMEKAHPGTTALFVQGCGADANPLPRRSVELAQKYGQVLAASVDTVLNGKMKAVGGPVKTAFELVDLPFQGPRTREEIQKRLDDKNSAWRRRAEHLLKILDGGGTIPEHYAYPVQVWQFGRDLKFIALGGEVVVDYSLRLKGQYGWEDTWVAGYSNDVFGYVPSLRVLKEGGYEGGDANTSLPGPFGAAVEEIIVEKVGQLVERTRN
ncbi:MAG: neutral/alkaline non-lysosomal ceramidase N-terminal domain-containing protein [Bryobacteraceae bacterium]